MGSTAEGINREAATSIECGALCRDKNCKSLSIPETAILRLASRIPAAGRGDQQRMIIKRSGLDDSQLRCCWDDISRGILPSLRHVVNREWAVHRAPNAAGKITVDEPDSAIDPSSTPVDPFGNDYFCRLCDSELANTYYHCEGCEQLLSKDFNTCLRCFTETKFLTNVKMNEGYVMHAKHNHVGNPRKKCECNEMCTNVCPHCSRLSCCCSCHTRLTKHYRFFPPDDLLEILKKLEERVGENEIVFSEETTNRLGLTPMTQTAQCAGDNQRCRQYEMEGADSISQEGADLHLMDRELLDSSLSNEVFDSDTEDHRGTDDLNNFKVRSIASPDGPADCRQDSTAVQIPPQRTESIIAKLIQSSTLEGKLKPSSASFVEGASVDFCDDVAHKQSSLTKLVEDDGENDKSEKNTNHLEQTTMTQAKQCSGVKQYNMEGANSISQTSIDPSIPVQLHDGELLDASYRRNGLFDSDSDDRRCSDDSNDATFIASPDEPADCRQDLTEVQGTVINLCGSFVHDKSAIDDVACVPKVFQDNFDSSPARFIMNPATSMSDGKRTSIYRGDGQEHDRRVDTIKDVQYKKGPIPTFVEDMEVFPLPTVNRE